MAKKKPERRKVAGMRRRSFAFWAAQSRVGFDPDIRKRLLGVLPDAEADELVKEFEAAATEFGQLRRLSIEPAVSQEAVAGLSKTARRLRRDLRGLDPRSRAQLLSGLLERGLPDDWLRRLAESLQHLASLCEQARGELQRQRTPGRPPDRHRNRLAMAIAESLQRHGVATTKYRDGKFAVCLGLVLEAVGAHPPEDPADLLKRAIDMTRG